MHTVIRSFEVHTHLSESRGSVSHHLHVRYCMKTMSDEVFLFEDKGERHSTVTMRFGGRILLFDLP